MCIHMFMLMCKIMSGDVNEVPGIVASKAGLKYQGPEVDAMAAVAKAHKEESLHDFIAVRQQYEAQLVGDVVVTSHLQSLYDTLLEKNLLRIIRPYEKVSVAYIAELIKLDAGLVERKLSAMVLDKKLLGTLDQGSGFLLVFQETASNSAYTSCLATLESLTKVVDTLMSRSQKVLTAQ